MLKPSDQFHGSDLEKIESLYGIRKEEIVSFSANVNPLGLSRQFKERLSAQLDVITTYPDRTYQKLRETIASYCKTESDRVIVGNGSTELISLVIQIQDPKKALILGPTYSEYEREVCLSGGTCSYFPLEESADFALNEDKLKQALQPEIDLFILCNPNNPTSTLIGADRLRTILDLCRQRHIFVMVDETYMEFVRDVDAASAIPLTEQYDNLVVLRGVSKFFASPGLRLGYAVTADETLIRSAARKQNPWSVSSIAETAGRLLFTDTDYIRRTRELIDSQRQHVFQKLSVTDGLKVYPPCANFVLVRLLKESLSAAELFDMAIRRGMMIRNCSTFPFLDDTYFRFCFMKPDDNERLLSCIREFVS
ncbi:threonine-phosphate decarboxylase CobD [Lachnospiraceae bacterium JLR.KK008]